MRIFINDNLYNDFNIVMREKSIFTAQETWGKNHINGKSTIDLSIFNTPLGSISLLFGPRQIGKTASLKLFLTQVQDCETLIFTDCSIILNRADLYSHLKKLIQGKTTLVLDEVQSVQEWHLALRALYSENRLSQCRVWCTGSEARYLLESGERLPGRKGDGITVFAKPWSFREYMDHFYSEEVENFKTLELAHLTQKWLDDQTANWETPWAEYMKTGGFPKIIGEYRTTGHISDSTFQIYTDWILGSWSKLRTPERSLSALANRLCETLNSRVSYDALRKGTDILSPNTVKTLLEIQEDHFSIKMLPRFNPSQKAYMPTKLKKIYPLDPFIAQVWNGIGKNIRRLFETHLTSLPLDECAFHAQFYRKFDPMDAGYLYSDATQSEVDFYFKDCAFELKSNGNPTPKQKQLLNTSPQSFVVRKGQLPIMAYLVGEKRV